MKIKGTLTSGSGEGAYYMSKELYSHQFKEKLGFEPYPGTLNIIIQDKDIPSIKECILHAKKIKGKEKFGDVLYMEAALNNKIKGAIIFPVKTHHPPRILEFIAPVYIRQTLKLKDGDTVTILADCEKYDQRS
ncbi:MAG TPA: CTP-dependent riboflavin kinase [Methanothermobacter sp.]|nr:riboflavin kinase [Methanothermobacter sp. MT-2]HHW04751.1 CTP-dependent riboflavin kinase [Methanothermobacter sp.]HOK72237.1 CTP-dependent riboflavin kinase [Methanothermobacter sp.]HOL68962.1 CTP-dependent riboflavin kinase [Methanothermobacter sp.]HPQ04899.1 CTP-dependent riboflavin kinase [Methanothermobacter sp.]